jgi:hypothetical protein
VRRAVVLGGTGGVGWAVTRRLLAGGWEVTVTGRAPERVPPELVTSGARFVQAERHESATLPQLLGGGADLVVDCACYTAAEADGLLPFLRDVTSTVLLSSKAVYVDAQGRRPFCELRRTPVLRRPGHRGPADASSEWDTLRLEGRLRAGQGRRGGGAPVEWASRDGSPRLEDPRSLEPSASGVALRPAGARPPTRRAARPRRPRG